MRAWLIGFVCFCVTIVPLYAHADSKSPIQKLTDISNKIYEDISGQHLEMAMDDLKTFKETWDEISIQDKSLSPVAVRTITASEEKLSKSLEVNDSEKAINETSVEFQLAVDALVNSKHPLWMGMREKVLGAFSKMVQDVKADDDQAFQVDLNQFLDLYQMVYPSMTIDSNPESIKDLDAKMNHLINSRMTIVQDQSTHLPHLISTQSALNKLFGGTEEASAFVHTPGLFTPSLFIGGLVILTLLYVVWRKYRGEDESNTHVTVMK